jgi:AraC family transcriptional regulator
MAGSGPRVSDSVAIHSLASAHRCVASPPISTSSPAKGHGSASRAMEGLSYALGAELVRESMPKEGAHPPPWLRQLHELLSENPCGKFALADLATLVGIHPVHVSRQFKRYYGEPLWDHVRRRRIEIGAQKLLSGWGTLCEIAHSLGFSDHAQFTRTFKRFMGVTPSELRFRQRSAQSERRLKLR